MATAQLNKNFVFALGAEDRVELENMLIEQPRFMLTLFSDIDAEKVRTSRTVQDTFALGLFILYD